MLPLTKVRMKLLKSKESLCYYCAYILIMLIFFFLMSHVNISRKNIPMKIYSNTILSDVNLLSIDNYSKLQTYLKRTSLIVNDADIGEKLRKFIKNKLGVNVDLNNNTMENQIKLDYNKDEDSYKFLYFIKDRN